jgi:hypothetical protein
MRDIRTDRRIPMPEKTALAGGNALRIVFKLPGKKDMNLAVLTRLALALTLLSVERACNTFTTGLSHLNNLVSPFLISSNAWDCS